MEMKAVTATAVENMKRQAKAIRKQQGIQHSAALDQVAKEKGFASWHAVTQAAVLPALGHPTPPVGTPTTSSRQGNSTPALAPAAGLNQSPVISPVSGQ